MALQDTAATEIGRTAPSPEGDLAVRVVAGPEAGAELLLQDGRRVLVGQSQVCELRLTDKLVSRRHVALEKTGGGVRATDLGSTNGTFIGAVRILAVLLAGGEQIRVGETVLELVRVQASASAAAPDAVSRADRFGRLLGLSPAMRALYPLCERLAASTVGVLIEGETGTGKEVLAEALHEAGPRASQPFVVFDCTTISPNLVESELFGHERGAFTGAVASRAGLFEQAAGGTLLIDEIGDLDLALQPKLLRVLERGEVRRVGGSRSVRIDVRILAATRRDLDREVHQGRFRDDLFHRLAVARIELPPLRARKGDVAFLARHIAGQLGASASAIPYAQMTRWEDAPWPGNVRELRNAVARYLAIGELAQPPRVAEAPSIASSFGPLMDLPIGLARERLVTAFERDYVARVLEKHGGNVEAAAAASGIARRQFFRLKAKAGREE